MSLISDTLREHPIIYVTRDIERALGLPLTTEGYFIIANSTPFAKAVVQNNSNVLLIESNELLDTHELLTHPQVTTFIEQRVGAKLMVFKNTTQIEKICAANNWTLLNPPAILSQKIEDKISQVEWLGDLGSFLPEHKIHVLQEVWFDGTPFILQFNRAHTGNGTILIENKDTLHNLKTQFPDRPVRITEYVAGPMFTVNAVITSSGTGIGSDPSYQITGLAPFTDQPFATIGNDWSLAKKLLSEKAKTQLTIMVENIGKKLFLDGWHGLFGLDVVLAKDTDTLYLIEINARQPASTTFESQLQILQQKEEKLTTFEAHITSLLSLPLDYSIAPVQDGAQIIVRNHEGKKWTQEELSQVMKQLEILGTNVICYTNETPGSDLLRIQSNHGIMADHKIFNETGQKIYDCIINRGA